MLNLTLEGVAGQVVIGLINGSFYAMMSLGLAIVFGLLKIANFFHGVQFMLGAFIAWLLLNIPELYPELGLPAIGFWGALVIAPALIGGMGLVFERLVFRRLYQLDHMYGFLLTLGAALVVEGTLVGQYGSTGNSYPAPALLRGAANLGFLYLPVYRIWVIATSLLICLATWYALERTKLGASLRAATENPTLVQAFGIDVPRLIMLSYGASAALAGIAGVMSAPIYQFNPLIASDIIIVIFAVVVIGGLGSVAGSIIAGISLGGIEGLTRAIYPDAQSAVVFIVMVVVLIFKPAGLFGRAT